MGDIYTNPPQSRNEAILRATIDGTEYTVPPQSRIEDLLLELKEAIEQGGGAGGMSKDTYDPDDAVATAGGIAAYVDDEITDLHLGTASTKNSTSVVTQSTDLVESGAVLNGIKSAYQLTEDTTGWSGKNRLPITISELKRLNTAETWSGNVYVRYGITFSVTTDDDGNVTEIDGDGRATGAVYFSVGNMNIGSSAMDSIDNPKANGYILSAHASVHLKYSTSSHNFVFDIPNGTQLNHAKLYPMLRRDNVIDATFEPYHASVEESKVDNSVIGTVEDGTNPTKAYAVGEFMVRDGAFCQVTAPVTTSSTWTEGSNYTKKSIAEVLQSLMS